VKHGAKYLLFSFVLAGATLVLGEITLRAVQFIVTGVSPFTLLPKYSERRFLLSPFLAFGPRIDWRIPDKPNQDTAYFNSQGLRTMEFVGPKPRDEYRIIALGGSTTEDVWTEDGRHWPWWLERELDSGHRRVRVLNSGMSAYTSAHTLVRLQFDALDHSPDLVLVMHNINDLVVNYYAAVSSQPVDGHYRAPYADKQFTGHMDESDIVVSRLVNAVRGRMQRRQLADGVPTDYRIDNGLRYFRRNLRSIHAVGAAHQTPVVFITMPLCASEAVYRRVELQGRQRFSAPLPKDFARFNDDFARYNQAIMDTAAEVGAPVIDMNRLFGGDDQWFSDFVHYNAEGSRRFGQLLGAEFQTGIRKQLSQP